MAETEPVSGRDCHWTEANLERYWLQSGHSIEGLTDNLGRSVEVIYAGRRSPGPGPDIEDAILSFDDGRACFGDVEVHLNPADWHRHGHHEDPGYENVVLHVVWAEPDATFTGPPTVAIGGTVSGLPPETAGSDRWTKIWPCGPGFRVAGRESVGNLLAWQGWQRVVEKSHAYESETEVVSADEVLFSGVLDALGYSRNREAFRALATLLTWEKLRPFVEGGPAQMLVPEAVMFGSAGLLPSQRAGHPPSARADDRTAQLERIWNDLRFPALEEGIWRFHGVRPNNWPTRRIAAAARLFSVGLSNPPVDSLLLAVFAAVEAGDPRLLENLFSVPVASSSYWAWRIDFGRPAKFMTASLLGVSRAREIVVNVALPLAVCMMRKRGHAAMHGSLRDLFFSTGAVAPNRITRYMGSLTGADSLRGMSGAARQQGMLHIYRHWCRSKECRDCPAGQPVPVESSGAIGLALESPR